MANESNDVAIEDPTSPVVGALMAAVDGGVLICDASATIRRHDVEAVRLLRSGGDGADGGAASLVGQAAADYVDARLLATAFRTARDRATTDAPVVFVTPGGDGRLLRVGVRPVTSEDEGASLFVVHLQPKQAWSEAQPMSHQLLRELIESMRAPLASVRAAIETMTQYPSMDASTAAQFESIIEDQTLELSDRLEAAVDAYAAMYRSAWPLEEMAATGMVELLGDRVRRTVDVPLTIDAEPDELLRVRADVFALSHAVAFLARRVVNAARCSDLTLRLHAVRRFAAVDVSWTGTTVSTERLRQWESETLSWGDTIVEMTLREIIDHHDAQIWTQHDGDAARLRLLLPAINDGTGGTTTDRAE